MPARVNGVATKNVFKLTSIFDQIIFTTRPLTLSALIKFMDAPSPDCASSYLSTNITLAYAQGAGDVPIAMSLRTYGYDTFTNSFTISPFL